MEVLQIIVTRSLKSHLDLALEGQRIYILCALVSLFPLIPVLNVYIYCN